jgi:hypothetical protein
MNARQRSFLVNLNRTLIFALSLIGLLLVALYLIVTGNRALRPEPLSSRS